MPARSLCAVPADRIHPLRLNTPAQQRDLGLSTDSSLTIAALGVVYGDIGTSPLYAVRQSLIDFGDLSERAILGALSLIVWALVLVVTVKYVLVIMRADNRGEGGLLALTALVLRRTRRGRKRYLWIMAAGLVGTSLVNVEDDIRRFVTPFDPASGQQVADAYVETQNVGNFSFVQPSIALVLTTSSMVTVNSRLAGLPKR